MAGFIALLCRGHAAQIAELSARRDRNVQCRSTTEEARMDDSRSFETFRKYQVIRRHQVPEKTVPIMNPSYYSRPAFNQLLLIFTGAVALLAVALTAPAATETELKDLAINGGVQNGKARLIIEGQLFGGQDQTNALFATTLEQLIAISREKQTHT